jgi:hypothetical protein
VKTGCHKSKAWSPYAVELRFKEWKIYANLHRPETGNPDPAARLIWSSFAAVVLKCFLCAGADRCLVHRLSMHRVALARKFRARPCCYFDARVAGACRCNEMVMTGMSPTNGYCYLINIDFNDGALYSDHTSNSASDSSALKRPMLAIRAKLADVR